MSSITCARCGAINDGQVVRCSICGQLLSSGIPMVRPALSPAPRRRMSRRSAILTFSAGAVLLSAGGYLAYKKLVDPRVLTYGGHNGMAIIAAWSPDGKRVASVGANSTILVWSPDGKSLLVVKSDIEVWQIEF